MLHWMRIHSMQVFVSVVQRIFACLSCALLRQKIYLDTSCLARGSIGTNAHARLATLRFSLCGETLSGTFLLLCYIASSVLLRGITSLVSRSLSGGGGVGGGWGWGGGVECAAAC